MSPRTIANNLKVWQRNILISHAAEGIKPIVREGPMTSFNALMNKGLIRGTTVNGGVPCRPTHSVLTDLGRQVVAYILAEAAEALVAAGCFETPAPSEQEIRDCLKLPRKADPAEV
jgi:hypothetical protein